MFSLNLPPNNLTNLPVAPSLKILLVEDNKINQQLAIRMLLKLGSKVDVASDGLECLSKLKDTSYDLIFMDICMPGMSGIQVTKHIRGHPSSLQLPKPFIVALTANVMDSDRAACLEAGMNDFIPKPFCLSDFERALKEAALNRHE